MWQSVHVAFAKNKKCLRQPATSTKLIHVTKSQERHFGKRIKAPAAAKKASTKLIRVVTNPGTPFFQEKNACGNQETATKCIQ